MTAIFLFFYFFPHIPAEFEKSAKYFPFCIMLTHENQLLTNTNQKTKKLFLSAIFRKQLTAFSPKLFSQKISSQMYDRLLDTPLLSLANDIALFAGDHSSLFNKLFFQNCCFYCSLEERHPSYIAVFKMQNTVWPILHFSRAIIFSCQ